MKIGIGADHGGFEMKEELKKRLADDGYEVTDKGCYSLEEVDYPDVAADMVAGIGACEYECGILICGTGIGMSIAANKGAGIRAALITDVYSARMAKAHNNANIVTLGARTIGVELAYELVKAYLKEEFLGGKHQGRVTKIQELEKNKIGYNWE